MNYQIKGENLPVVICDLEENETVITERGSMSWMSPNIKMETGSNGSIGKIFRTASENMKEKSAGGAWGETVDKIETSLTEEDKEIIKNLGRMLGKTDLEGQVSEIKLVQNFLNTQIEIAEEEKQKNEKLYKTLGGVVGLAVIIILV